MILKTLNDYVLNNTEYFIEKYYEAFLKVQQHIAEKPFLPVDIINILFLGKVESLLHSYQLLKEYKEERLLFIRTIFEISLQYKYLIYREEERNIKADMYEVFMENKVIKKGKQLITDKALTDSKLFSSRYVSDMKRIFSEEGNIVERSNNEMKEGFTNYQAKNWFGLSGRKFDSYYKLSKEFPLMYPFYFYSYDEISRSAHARDLMSQTIINIKSFELSEDEQRILRSDQMLAHLLTDFIVMMLDYFKMEKQLKDFIKKCATDVSESLVIIEFEKKRL